MTTIKVELDAFYGYGHGGGCYGSNETIEVEINDQELDALRKLGAKEISCEAVMETIESGDTTLQSLHERLEEKFYYMVEEYWLYEADNEFRSDSLYASLKKDMDSGIYPPVPYKKVLKWFESAGNFSLDDSDFDFLDGFDTTYIYGKKQLQERYNEYIQDKYLDWVKQHDHEFAAERIGLDLDACRDDEVDYTITIS
jgi:hypothetical protein